MIYILCFASSTFFAYMASRTKNKAGILMFSVISILIPSILGGLRAHGVGTDTGVYGIQNFMEAQHTVNMIDYVIGDKFFEAGYKLLVYVIANTLGHVNWCYFAFQLITVTCVYIGAFKHRDKISMPLSMLVFFFIYYNDTYNMMRQSMAAAIIFMEIDKLEKKQYLKFSAAIIVASLFHGSAFLAFPLLLGMHFIITSLTQDKKNGLNIFIVYASLLLLILFRPVMVYITNSIAFFAKYRAYFSSLKYSEVAVTQSFGMLLLGELIMVLFYGKGAVKLFQNSDTDNFSFYRFNLLFCTLFVLAVRFFTSRILAYQYYANNLVLAALPRFVQDKHLRLIVSTVVLCVYAFYWWHIYVVRGNSATWPYRSIL